MLEQREWCEQFVTYACWGTYQGPVHECRRCRRAYIWSGFESIKVGPCIAERWPCSGPGAR
jgi:hypothetical protein